MSGIEDAIAAVELCLDVGWLQGKELDVDGHGQVVGYCLTGSIAGHIYDDRNDGCFDAGRFSNALRVVADSLGMPPTEFAKTESATWVVSWNDHADRTLEDIRWLRDQLVARRVAALGDAHNHSLM